MKFFPPKHTTKQNSWRRLMTQFRTVRLIRLVLFAVARCRVEDSKLSSRQKNASVDVQKKLETLLLLLLLCRAVRIHYAIRSFPLPSSLSTDAVVFYFFYFFVTTTTTTQCTVLFFVSSSLSLSLSLSRL